MTMVFKSYFKNYFLFFDLKTIFKNKFEKHDQIGSYFLFIFKSRK